MARSPMSLSTCIALLIALMISTVAAADKSKIIVGGDHEFPPYEFLENGEPTGFNIDLIRAVAEVMDLGIEIRLGPWNKARRDLEQRKIDIIAGMVYSDERDILVHFSVPHTMVFPGLFVRRESNIHAFADINGKEIIVQEGDIMHDFMEKESIASRIIPVTNYSEALMLLASGKHDSALLPSELYKYYIAGKFALNNLRVVKTDLPPLRYCFAVAEDNRELLFKLDQGMIILKATGEYQKIYDKWFGVYEKKEWLDAIKYYILALAIIAAFFIISLLWTWSLKRQVSMQTAELRMNEKELQKAHLELEKRVEARTVDLAMANDKLKLEIIERRKVEKALRQSKEEYRAIVNAFDGQIYICSPDRKIEFMNHKLIERTGRDATGESCYSVLHDRDSICPWCINDEILKGKTVSWELQSPKDNRWYYVVNTPIYRSNGSISKQAMILDITDRVEADKEKQRLVAQNLRLQKAESLGRMAGAIAHHFNNKLHVVIGHLELVTKNLHQDEKTIIHLNAAMQAADQAAEVSRSMLTYLGKVTGEHGLLDLSEICKNSLSLIQATLPKQVTLETDLPYPGPAINTNLNQIQLILTNLIGNSKEAIGGEQGAISLSVKTASSVDVPAYHRFPINWQPGDKTYASLEIRDTGCGMAEKDLMEAFDPFFSTKFTGRGLGLSVVLGLVQAHGGVITVESAQGLGSVFCVFFPMIEGKVLPLPETIATQAQDIEGVGTVLLVDDDRIVLTITKEMLSNLGFKVLSALDGVEAVQIFQQHKNEIRFVLTDFAMPHMNGLEMLSSLRQIAPDIPVILASGYSEEEVMDTTHSECPNFFLEKPFGAEELKKAIHYSLEDKQEGTTSDLH